MALRQRASDWGALWLSTRATTRRPRPSFNAAPSSITPGLCKLVKTPMLSGRRLSSHWPYPEMVHSFSPLFGPELASILTSQRCGYVIVRHGLRDGEGWGW